MEVKELAALRRPHGSYKKSGADWTFVKDSSGKVVVTYIDPKLPGARYECVAASDSDWSIANAIQAHIDKRKATGEDYVGSPDQNAKTVTVAG